MTFASNKVFRLTSALSPSVTSLTGDGTTVVTSGTLLLQNPAIPNTETLEFVRFTGITNNGDGTYTYTGLTRSLSTSGIPVSSTGSGNTWAVGTIATLVAFYDELEEWLTGIEVNGFTTAQMNALVVPSGTSRIILNTDTGVLYQYIGGTWSTFATGTTVNASITVAGKVQEATDSNIASATEIGSSGAPLAVNPKSTSTTAVAGKLPVLDSNGTIIPFIWTLVPSGIFLPYGGSSAPTGWILCDGSAVSRTTYATLFTAIGTAYGTGDGSTTFNIPDLRGRIAVGKNAATFSTLGATGGEETHTLTTPEIPWHTHSLTWNVVITGSANVASWSAFSLSSQTATWSTWGGGAHNNLQPYVVSNYIIKT